MTKYYKCDSIDKFYADHDDFSFSIEHEYYQDWFEEIRDYLANKGASIIKCDEDCIEYKLTTNQ